MGKPKEVSLELINYIGERVTAEANRLQSNADFGGAMNDGGAGRLRDQLSFYYSGFHRQLPKEWSEYEKDFRHSKDPDYARYLELKRKFEP